VDAVLDGRVDDRRRLVAPVGDPDHVDVRIGDQLVGVLVHRGAADEFADVPSLRRHLVGSFVHRIEGGDIHRPSRLTDGGDLDVEPARDREVRVPVVVIHADVTDGNDHTFTGVDARENVLVAGNITDAIAPRPGLAVARTDN